MAGARRPSKWPTRRRDLVNITARTLEKKLDSVRVRVESAQVFIFGVSRQRSRDEEVSMVVQGSKGNQRECCLSVGEVFLEFSRSSRRGTDQ